MAEEQSFITGVNVISLHDFMIELEKVEAVLEQPKLSEELREKLTTRRMKLKKMVDHLSST